MVRACSRGENAQREKWEGERQEVTEGRLRLKIVIKNIVFNILF